MAKSDYVYKGPLPKSMITRLEKLGFETDVLLDIEIEIGTKKARWITNILSSSATVIGRTIYFRKHIDEDSLQMVAFVGHEVIHIMQWKNETLFLAKYIGELINYTFIYLFNLVSGRKKMKKHWIHDQISFEREAIAVQYKILSGDSIDHR